MAKKPGNKTPKETPKETPEKAVKVKPRLQLADTSPARVRQLTSDIAFSISPGQPFWRRLERLQPHYNVFKDIRHNDPRIAEWYRLNAEKWRNVQIARAKKSAPKMPHSDPSQPLTMRLVTAL
jgi:hypothetical protein